MAATWRHLRAHSVLTAVSVAQSPSNSPVTNDSGCPLHNRARASMTQRLTTEPSNSLTPTPHTHTHAHTNNPENSPDMTARRPSLTPPFVVFFPLHLTRDNPQYRSVLVRRADVTRCPPVKLIWIYTVEETARERRKGLHYDWKKECGIQPRGSFLYARLIKCLTASVDGITDCWTKTLGVGSSARACVCVCSSSWVSTAWQRLACDKPAAPHQHTESTTHSPAFAVHHSGWPRVAPWEEVRRGGKRVGGKRRQRWEGRGWRKSRSGVKCKEDSNERQLSCTTARPGAPVSRRTCKVCRSRPDNTPTFLHKEQHTRTRTHWEFREKRLLAPLSERHRQSDNMPVKLSLPASHMQGKVRLMKKNTLGGGWSGKNHWDMNKPVRTDFKKIWCRVNAGTSHPKRSAKGSQKK